MSVRYKFTSWKSNEIVPISGSTIRASELKLHILRSRGIERGVDVDLVLTDSNTKIPYTDAQPIPRGTLVHVIRKPRSDSTQKKMTQGGRSLFRRNGREKKGPHGRRVVKKFDAMFAKAEAAEVGSQEATELTQQAIAQRRNKRLPDNSRQRKADAVLDLTRRKSSEVTSRKEAESAGSGIAGPPSTAKDTAHEAILGSDKSSKQSQPLHRDSPPAKRPKKTVGWSNAFKKKKTKKNAVKVKNTSNSSMTNVVGEKADAGKSSAENGDKGVDPGLHASKSAVGVTKALANKRKRA